MAQGPLQGGQGDALLDGRDRERVVQDAGDIIGYIPYTTYGLINTLRASSSRLRLVSCA